ncbi:MAG TPA: hypothetical protein VFJ19_20840 [Nocardioidaceae bacterium]|nr:hypothetical protein [Nocardioidaceae bacterium]
MDRASKPPQLTTRLHFFNAADVVGSRVAPRIHENYSLAKQLEQIKFEASIRNRFCEEEYEISNPEQLIEEHEPAQQYMTRLEWNLLMKRA